MFRLHSILDLKKPFQIAILSGFSQKHQMCIRDRAHKCYVTETLVKEKEVKLTMYQNCLLYTSFTQEKKMERKVAEVFMAFALERDYSKNEILELYVNTIYFGNGYYCIKDASEGYFGKEPEDLTDYESTLLAGVPNAPSKYSPTVNLELAEKRQEQVVERLVACGLFTKERAQETPVSYTHLQSGSL